MSSIIKFIFFEHADLLKSEIFKDEFFQNPENSFLYKLIIILKLT